jgi:cysteine-rich repeat protein
MGTPHDEGKRAGMRILLALVCSVALCLLAFAGQPKAHADTIQTSASISICGNGIIDGDEFCDTGLGNNTGAYGSTTAERHCFPDCSAYGPYCGDGILQARFGEQCDEGAANSTSGLCSPTCVSQPAVPPAAPSQNLGSTPNVPGATPGAIPSATQTQVVLRGKAYPNTDVNILLDGKPTGIAHTDSNADFLYSAVGVTPGTATYSFWAQDSSGVNSLTTSVVFDVVQSALTSVNNIFIPPSLALSSRQISPGDPVTLSGESVPLAKVITNLDTDTSNALVSPVDGSGMWALRLDTGSIAVGLHSAKVSFVLSTTSKSGYGKSVTFFVGDQSAQCGLGETDINGDKKVNLVDFSIFLLGWGTANTKDDFNCDGKVNLADFSILLFNWTG